jgi:protein-tyrosine phosphatase
MSEILDTIRLELNDSRPVYFHCWGGIGRTGTVAGCWLVEQGLSPDEALERINVLRRRVPDRGMSSPENETQREFVRSWRRQR